MSLIFASKFVNIRVKCEELNKNKKSTFKRNVKLLINDFTQLLFAMMKVRLTLSKFYNKYKFSNKRFPYFIVIETQILRRNFTITQTKSKKHVLNQTRDIKSNKNHRQEHNGYVMKRYSNTYELTHEKGDKTTA